MHIPFFRFGRGSSKHGLGPGLFAQVELLFDTLPRGGAPLRDDCPCQRCGLSPKIYFVIVFDFTDDIKIQRQFSL